MRRKWIIIMLLLLGATVVTKPAKAQSDEVVQLLLNVEKLAQLKQILSDLKKGYDIVSNGYGAIKNIAEGNFSMHEVFLDGLMAVSPSVRKYHKVVEIINYQVILVKEYKRAFNRFKSAGRFSPKEIDYLARTYERLFIASLQNIDELTNVVTANKLRMSDDERLKAIDKIHEDIEGKLTFLRQFNNSNTTLMIQRENEMKQLESARKMYDLK